jgi:hypothetical protein
MVVSETRAGTPIVEMSADEYSSHLEREVERVTGMSVEEFRRAYVAGELDDADPSVSELVGLLRIGQNGQSTGS